MCLFVLINPMKMFVYLGASEGHKWKGQGELSHSHLSKIKWVTMEPLSYLFFFSVPAMLIVSYFLH